MDRNKWKDTINGLNIKDNIKDNIISFFHHFGHNDSFSFIKITDQKVIAAFNNINNYRPLSICLDIEFQTLWSNSKEYNYADDEINAAKFIREIGMMFFLNDKINVYYIGHIFLNFQSLHKFKLKEVNKKDIRLITSKYATVTPETYESMTKYEDEFHIEKLLDTIDENTLNNTNLIKKVSKTLYQNYLFKKILSKKAQENIKTSFEYLIAAESPEQIKTELKYIRGQLNQIQFNIYAKDLERNSLLNFNKIYDLYWNDPLVKDRLKLIEGKYDKFMELFSSLSKDAILVIKGKMDLLALKNTVLLVNPKITLDLDRHYDIEIFNGFSKNHFGSAQLEATYKGLTGLDIYKDSVKELFDEISKSIGEKAHNPVVDSLFTIVVAIIINLGLNDQFSHKLAGGYYGEYLKYKKRYLIIKKST